MKKKVFLTMLIAILGLSLLLNAQPSEPYPGFQSRSPNKEIIQQYRSLELLKTLELSEEQSHLVLPVIKEIEVAREEHFTQYHQKLDELAAVLEDEKPSAKKLKELSSELFELQRTHWETEQRNMQRLGAELTEEQFARYLLFENRFQQRLRQRVMEYQKSHQMPNNK